MIEDNQKIEIEKELSERVKRPNGFTVYPLQNEVHIYNGNKGKMCLSFATIEAINKIKPILFIDFKHHYVIGLKGTNE